MSNNGVPVIVIGAGVQAAITARTLMDTGLSVEGFYADDPPMIGKFVVGLPVKGTTQDIPVGARAVIGIGDNEARKRLTTALDMEWITAVHPSATVDPDATIGAGTIVHAGAIVEIGAQIRCHAIVNTLSSVHHQCHVSDYAQLRKLLCPRRQSSRRAH
jgi:hypothetical protein